MEKTFSDYAFCISPDLAAKAVTAAFHLHNRKARRELKDNYNGKVLSFYPVPTYLGV